MKNVNKRGFNHFASFTIASRENVFKKLAKYLQYSGNSAVSAIKSSTIPETNTYVNKPKSAIEGSTIDC